MHMPKDPLVADTLQYSFVTAYFQMSRIYNFHRKGKHKEEFKDTLLAQEIRTGETYINC